MSDNRITAIVRRILYAVLVILGLYIGIKYLLPWTAPFILAFITASCMEPIIKYAERHTQIKRWIISGILTIMFLSLLFFCGQKVIVKAFSSLTDFLSELPETLSGALDSLSWINRRIYGYISTAPDGIREYLETALENILISIQQLPGEFSGTALRYATQVAGYMPKILLFIGTYAVGEFFISSRYPEVKDFLLRQIPEKHRSKTMTLKSGIIGTVIKWLKAQLMLMGVTFLELTAGFILLRINHPMLIALGTSLIDALPVLGVGTVLLPWAVLQLITGNTSLALGLSVLYVAVTLIRNLLEPKLVGAQLGLHPVATLLAMYVGFCSVGVVGMILFPMGLIILKHLNDEEIIKLWK